MSTKREKYVVFVCTGNTCRSPMAVVLAESIFKAHNIHAAVFSAGVSAWDGQPASTHAISAMEEEKLDLRQHSSQIISYELLSDAALVLTMTAQHLAIIKSAYPDINAFALDVSDPFGGDLQIYRQTGIEIKQKIISNLEKIKEALA